MGVEAPLFMGRTDGLLGDELAQDLSYEVPAAGRWNAALETAWMIAHLPAVIRRTRPDVLFCAGNTYSVVAVFMKLLLGRECPPILAKISNDLVRPDLSPFVRFWHARWAWLQGRLIDGWVVIHAGMRDETRRVLPNASLAIIPDPALTEEQLTRLCQWQPRSSSTGGRRFVAMGRLVPQKNYGRMLRGFTATARDGDELTIFGDGPERARLERLSYDLRISKRVRFAGHVSDASVNLQGQDVLLLSSDYEGVPAVLIEGLASGIPIVATDCGAGVRALLAGIENVEVVGGPSTKDFAAAMDRVVRSPPVRRTFEGRDYTIEAGASAYVSAFAAMRASLAAVPVAPDQAGSSLAGSLEADILEDRRLA